MRENDVEESFVCGICEKRTFKRKKDLKYHEKNCGDEWRCDICNKTFPAIENLNRHKNVHTAPSQCEVCGKCFGTLQALSRHAVTHSGSKEHVCTQCSLKFTLPSNLRKHVKKYH